MKSGRKDWLLTLSIFTFLGKKETTLTCVLMFMQCEQVRGRRSRFVGVELLIIPP